MAVQGSNQHTMVDSCCLPVPQDFRPGAFEQAGVQPDMT